MVKKAAGEPAHPWNDLPTGTITLLFIAMEGSTQLLQRLGDRYGAVLADYRQQVRAAFEEWHGREVDTQGESLFESLRVPPTRPGQPQPFNALWLLMPGLMT